MGINGVDLSSNNSAAILSPPPAFNIAKATEGTTFTDPQYANYADYAFMRGMQFGAYHFFHAENLSARAEADHFMTIAKPRSLLCLLYTSDAADDSLRVDLGGRRIIKKKFF